MSITSPAAKLSGNGLYPIAATSSVFVGLFFCAGAYGHLAAAWSLMMENADLSGSQRLGLLLPGLLLAVTAFVNLCSAGPLWIGRRWVMPLALVVNLLATLYLGYLLHRGVPDHPIGVFLALASSHGILLGAIALGLTWPAVASEPRTKSDHVE